MRSAFLIAMAYVLLLLGFIDYGHVFQVSEAREGVVVAEMLRSGDYILPLRHAEIVPSKPILFHWISATAATLRGAVDESALRFPSLIGAAMCVFGLFLLMRTVVSLGAAYFAAVILTTSYGFHRLSLDGRVDMLFVGFLVLGLCCWLRDVLQKSSPAACMPFVCICFGFAVLTKGPLGLLLPLLIMSAIQYAVLKRSVFKLWFQKAWLWSLVIPAPWYVLATLQQGEGFVGRQLIFENLKRFVGGSGINSKPVWFYLENFWSQAAPWSVVLLCYGVGLMLIKFRGAPPRRYRPRTPSAELLWKSAWLWFAVVFVFLSIATGKRRAYLLPLLPAVAIILSIGLPQCLRLLLSYERLRIGRQHTVSSRIRRGVVVFLSFLVLLLLLILTALAGNVFPQATLAPEVKAVFATLVPVLAGRQLLLSISAAALIVGIYRVSKVGTIRASTSHNTLSSLLIMQFVLFGFVDTGLAVKGVTHGYEEFAKVVSNKVPNEKSLYFVKRIRDESFDGLFFYLNRTVLLRSPRALPDAPGYYLARSRWFELQPKSWRQAVEVLAVGGRQTDKAGEQLVLFRF